MSLKVFKDLDTSKQYKSGTRSFSWQKLGAPEMETHCRSFQKSKKKKLRQKEKLKGINTRDSSDKSLSIVT